MSRKILAFSAILIVLAMNIFQIHATGHANLNIPYTGPTDSMVNRILQNTTTTAVNITYDSSGNDWTGLCSTGNLQSPIDIEGIKGTCTNTMVFDFNLNTSAVTFTLNTSSTNLSATGTFGNFYATDINGNLIGYSCNSMAFHAPAEHTLDSNNADLELQFYCLCKKEFNYTTINSGFDVAIVAIQFFNDDTQAPNSFISGLNVGSTSSVSMNLSSALGNQLANPTVYYTYQGSTTYPPCTQDVNWYVVSQRITLTSTQLSQFKTYWSMNTTFANGNGNNRAQKGVNGRTILKGGIQCQDQFVYFFSFFILYIFINYFIFKLL